MIVKPQITRKKKLQGVEGAGIKYRGRNP